MAMSQLEIAYCAEPPLWQQAERERVTSVIVAKEGQTTLIIATFA